MNDKILIGLMVDNNVVTFEEVEEFARNNEYEIIEDIVEPGNVRLCDFDSSTISEYYWTEDIWLDDVYDMATNDNVINKIAGNNELLSDVIKIAKLNGMTQKELIEMWRK